MGAAQTQGKGAYRIKMTEENRIGGGWVVDVYKIKRKDNNQVFAAKIFDVNFSILIVLGLYKSKYQIEVSILKTNNYPFIIKFIEEFNN